MNPASDAETIFRAGVTSVDPAPMIEHAVSVTSDVDGIELTVRTRFEEARYHIPSQGRIFATGMGKASARMAAGLETALGERLAGGLIAVKYGHTETLHRIRIMEAGHPVPDEGSRLAADCILGLDDTLGVSFTKDDIVVVLVSGGGSAILCAPAEGLDLEDKALTTRLLLASGATITEVNCVRKHLSAVKGGRLAAALAPARVLALVLSDVMGDDLDAIASGPTVPDPTSFADAFEIIQRYGLEASLTPAVMTRLRRGIDGLVDDTPKPGDPAFAATRTMLIGTNRIALAAAEAEASRLGYSCLVLSSRISGEAREIALAFLGIAKDISLSGFPIRKPACVIAGGETTVTIRGSGKGGRNQEMALAFLSALGRSPKGGEGITLLSAGTDGNDGPTDAAGACVDLGTYHNAMKRGIDPADALARNDSWTFFTEIGGLIKTGPTNTNVCDMQVLLVT